MRWTVGEYARSVGHARRTAFAHIQRARAEHLRRTGEEPPWLSGPGIAGREEAWYRVNIELLREMRPDMVKPVGIAQRVESLEADAEDHAGFRRRVVASMKFLEARIGEVLRGRVGR